MREPRGVTGRIFLRSIALMRPYVLSEDPTVHWWAGNVGERFWVEIRHVPGLGRELRCPLTDQDGATNAWYDLVGLTQAGDTVYHWNAHQHRFVGRSIVAAAPEADGDHRRVRLSGFVPLQVEVGLPAVRALASAIDEIKADLTLAHPKKSLYLPFQFRSDGLRMMSNYFAKLPRVLAFRLFGSSGLAEDHVKPEQGGDEAPVPGTAPISFLSPFKPKADTDYKTRISGGVFRRGRTHETLVNDFALFLTKKGLEVGRNAAIDLGLEAPPVVIEAKIVGRWPSAVREAVGQLYEYRFFSVARPDAGLVFLASEQVPEEWQRYLEHDRGIGVAWRTPGGFQLSSVAERIFGLRS